MNLSRKKYLLVSRIISIHSSRGRGNHGENSKNLEHVDDDEIKCECGDFIFSKNLEEVDFTPNLTLLM